jgi:hypothetical protein
MQYPNFYENITEARARLNRTVILYDDIPCQVAAITDHKEDGIFRMWLAPIGATPEELRAREKFDYYCMNCHPDNTELPGYLDAELAKNPKSGIMRKHMNSPKFKRFRPFPLGMCNVGTQTFYVERQPIRPKMEQGLVKSALWETLITAGSRQDNPRRVPEQISLFSSDFRDCILADHHDAATVLPMLLDPKVSNDAHAFHREFALVRGPLEMIFLAYRADIIGVLPKNNFSLLRLGREFRHCQEVVEELGLFNSIL